MKDTYYFKHDYNARNDPKIVALRRKFKGEGIAVYWVLAEILHENDDHHLQEKEYMFETVSEQSGVDLLTVKAIIDHSTKVLELLKVDNIGIYSERVNKNIFERYELSLKRSVSGSKGGKFKPQSEANAKQNESKPNQSEANAKQNESKPNLSEARKGEDIEITGNEITENKKESKENSLTFEAFLIENNISNSETIEFLSSEIWFEGKAMQLSSETSILIEKAKDFLIDVRDRDLIKGKELNDLRAHFVSWFKKKREFEKPEKKVNYLIPVFTGIYDLPKENNLPLDLSDRSIFLNNLNWFKEKADILHYKPEEMQQAAIRFWDEEYMEGTTSPSTSDIGNRFINWYLRQKRVS